MCMGSLYCYTKFIGLFDNIPLSLYAYNFVNLIILLVTSQ